MPCNSASTKVNILQDNNLERDDSNMCNHSLSPNRERFFNGIEFTQEMCKRVELYVNVIKLKPLQIKKALEKEFSNCEIYLSEVHKTTAKFYCEK
ncbi:14821_t:CDS:2 [Gigaspora rosea]|nr:14821_t:CDS:2 [Gigaspora rosea]